MNTNFNYQFNCACDEISSRSRRPIQRAKFHVRRIPKLIRRIYYFYKFTDFDDCLKNIFTYFFVGKKICILHSEIKIFITSSENFHSSFYRKWIFILNWFERLIIVLDPVTREIIYKNGGKNPPLKTKGQRPEIPI